MNKDVRDIARAVDDAESYVLATVTRTEGSSYRRPGARMLVGPTGRIAGSVSGGCLEGDLIRRGAWLAADGPRLLRVSTAAEPDETELDYPGCGGTLEILVEKVRATDDALALLRWIVAARAPAVLATVTRSDAPAIAVGARCAVMASAIRGDDDLAALCADDARRALTSGRSTSRTCIGTGLVEVFLEYLAPAHELLLAGRHHDVRPLVELGRLLGWEITVAASGTPATDLGRPDHLIELEPAAVRAWATGRPGAATILMTHSLALDRALLGALAEVPLAYLGLLGPRHRADDIFAQLISDGRATAASLAHVRAPVGLALGGDGPEAIALSITADLQRTWTGADAAAVPLRVVAGS